MSVTRIPACTTKGCPAPKDPDWHECWCGAKEIEHHHVESRGMGGTKLKSHIVALCHSHHEAVTLHDCYDVVTEFDWGKTYSYMNTDGEVLHTRTIGEAEGAGAEAVKSGSIVSTGRGGEGEADPTLPRGREGNVMPDSVAAHTLASAPSASPLSPAGVASKSGGATPRYEPPLGPPETDTKSVEESGAEGEAGSAAAEQGRPVVPLATVYTSRGSAAAPSASPLSPAEEAGITVSEGSRRDVGRSSSAGPSVFKEDWSGLSDDDLQLKFDTAHQMQGMAFLVKCKSVHAFRENHVQAWHESWTDHAIERFNISRRYCFAFANIWEISVGYDTNHIIPLTESRSLMQAIGRRSLEDGKAAMEVAVAHHAEYAESPSVGQLEHALGEEREPKNRHECPSCGQEHMVRKGA